MLLQPSQLVGRLTPASPIHAMSARVQKWLNYGPRAGEGTQSNRDCFASMRSWQASFKEAIRTNPKLSTTMAFELGLLCFAALKARTGKFAGVPPAATIIDAVPAVAAAVLAAPVIAQPKKRSRSRKV